VRRHEDLSAGGGPLLGWDEDAPLLGDPDVAAEDRAGRRRAQAHHHGRADVLLRVKARSAEYWTTGPGGRVATLVEFVCAKVTGDRFSSGESERVEM